MEKCLVLGADGFLGSYLVESLLKKGKKVRAFDRFSKGVPKNLTVSNKNLELFRGDFFNKVDIKRALKNIDVVFHFIWLSNPATSAQNPFGEIDINVRYTISLLESCVESKIKRFVFASSGGAIYGNNNLNKIPETAPTNPISPYGIGKLTVEKYLRFFEMNFGMETVSLRISNPYGKRQDPSGNQGIIAIFADRIKKGLVITIFGDGKTIRDYIIAKDAMDMCTQIGVKKNLKYHVYNIGSGYGTNILEIIDLLEKKYDKKANIIFKPSRNIDIKTVVLDMTRVEKELNFKISMNNINI